jgi:hypothetical protein
MRVPLCLAVHGHIADSVRDHEPGRVARLLWRSSWISMARYHGQPQKITGGPAVWPAWPAGSAGYAGRQEPQRAPASRWPRRLVRAVPG